MSEKENEEENSLKGCYGEHVSYTQLDKFLEDAFASNRETEEAESDEKFAICIWGQSGCVLQDTEIEVRKVGNGKHHKIFVVNPNPE